MREGRKEALNKKGPAPTTNSRRAIHVTATKVLLSYARADGAFVRRLYERLTSDGVECFFDEQSLVAAENLVLKISDAIDECNYLVIVMPPAYFAARFAPREWECIFVQDPRNERGRLVPLLLQDCELPALIRVLLHIDVTSTE